VMFIMIKEQGDEIRRLSGIHHNADSDHAAA
jgi:hypothetical protein